jgi:hypothetical protein
VFVSDSEAKGAKMSKGFKGPTVVVSIFGAAFIKGVRGDDGTGGDVRRMECEDGNSVAIVSTKKKISISTGGATMSFCCY